MLLPEDDADRQIANGFHVQLNGIRQLQVLRPAGGWMKVLEDFQSTHVNSMRRYAHRFMVLVIDFDGNENRRTKAAEYIPQDLRDRVFVIGALTTPEELKPTLGSYETIGTALANECRAEIYSAWEHPLLEHNLAELERLRQGVRPILFPA